LVATLLRMASTQTFTSPDGSIELCASRYRLLCELVGATRESVSLVLARMVGDGLARRDGNTFIIAPTAQLAEKIDGAWLDEGTLVPAFGGENERALH
jgi:hypothetical protein